MQGRVEGFPRCPGACPFLGSVPQSRTPPDTGRVPSHSPSLRRSGMSEPGQAMFVSYTVEPHSTLPKNTFGFSVTTPPGDQRTFTCLLFNEAGEEMANMVTRGGTTDSSPCDFTSF